MTESSISTESDGGLFGEDPFTQQPYVPVHLRPRNRSSLPFHERYSVTKDILAAYPPDLSGEGYSGRDWYVVWRGLELGIFMDYWYAILLVDTSLILNCFLGVILIHSFEA
jgi:hypothetical protein